MEGHPTTGSLRGLPAATPTPRGEVQDHLQEVTQVLGRGYLGFAATLADGRNITWPLTKRERPKIREMPPKVPEEAKEKLR